jgi:hypothetical protein
MDARFAAFERLARKLEAIAEAIAEAHARSTSIHRPMASIVFSLQSKENFRSIYASPYHLCIHNNLSIRRGIILQNLVDSKHRRSYLH